MRDRTVFEWDWSAGFSAGWLESTPRKPEAPQCWCAFAVSRLACVSAPSVPQAVMDYELG